MIIKGEYHDTIELTSFDSIDGLIWQDIKSICIDKLQATQLIAVLQKWVDGGEVE